MSDAITEIEKKLFLVAVVVIVAILAISAVMWVLLPSPWIYTIPITILFPLAIPLTAWYYVRKFLSSGRIRRRRKTS